MSDRRKALLFPKVISRSAISSLIASRFAYAINYYNISSVFFLIAAELGETIYGLGLITTSFLISIAVFQVPGGILAAKIGPKKTAVLGSVIYSAASLATALATG